MHTDPDIIAMIAMGETDGLADDVKHIRECAECARELDSLSRVAVLARSGLPEDGLETPDPEVWNRISQTLRLSPEIRPGSVAPSGAETARVESAMVDSAPVRSASFESAPQDSARESPSRTRRRDPASRRERGMRGGGARRSRRLIVGVLAAAAVVAVAAGGIGLAVTRATEPVVLASAALDPLADHPGASGEATVEVAADGARDVVVSVSGDSAAASDYREVWLLNADLDQLISLGVLAGDGGTFAIPSGVDLADYPVVDVSVEPIDGDPAHSGDSIVRGSLDL